MHETKTIGHFKVTNQKLGEGAFAAVYMGTDLRDGSPVAVKVYERSRIKEKQLSYLTGEVAATLNIHNEYIVGFLGFHKTQHRFYMFLEYCEEGDLAKLIRQSPNKRLQQQEALRYFYQIVRGFKAVVKQNFMHRDLKPANIFLKNGNVKIGDFGLVKMLGKDEMTKTQAGSLLNMSPQILQCRDYDNRVDIYSIGTVLYEMLFGTHPFYATNVRDMLDEIAKQKFDRFHKEYISKETEKLLRSLLRLDPDERMSWEELFAYEDYRKEKEKQKKYCRIEEFMKNIVCPSKISSLSGIFCIQDEANNSKREAVVPRNSITTPPNNNRSKEKTEAAKSSRQRPLKLLDLKLSTQLLVNLIKATEWIEEQPVAQTTTTKKKPSKK